MSVYDSSVFSFIGSLISKSTSRLTVHGLSNNRLERILRIQSYDLNFIFQKGPHKYSSGKVFSPRNDIFKKLHEIIKFELKKSGNDKQARRLDGLVNTLPEIQEFTSHLIFIYLIANRACKSLGDSEMYDHCETYLNPESSVSYSKLTGLSDFGCASPFSSVKAQHLSTASANTYTSPLGNIAFSNHCTPGLLLKTIRSTAYSNNMFSIDPTGVPSGIHLNNNWMRFDVPKASRCPTISSDADCTRPLSRALDEDEGYCESSVRTDYRLLNNEDIENTILRLFSQYSTAIGQMLVNEIFYSSFEPYFKEILSDKTLLANKTLDIILPLVSPSHIQKFSWESRGIGCLNKELPYLSETGPISAEAVLAAKKSRFGFLSSSSEAEEAQSNVKLRSTTIKSTLRYNDNFLHDLLVMRIGIQSDRFQFLGTSRPSQNENVKHSFFYPLTGHFLWVPHKCDPIMLGVSSHCLSHFVTDHIKAGTKYRQLCWFAHHSISLIPTCESDKSIWLGQIWACFIQGLKTWLRTYENSVYSVLSKLSNMSESGLLLITESLHYLSKQIEFVSDLCMLNYDQSDVSTYPLTKLHGIALLAYLMSKTDGSMSHGCEPIVRLLFKEAARPFIKFLEVFALDGIYDDIGNEFSLIVSSEHLFKQDGSFWTESFHFSTYDQILNIDIGTEKLIRASLSQLLPSGFKEEILCCAKSVLLLRSICPKHFLFQTRSKFPTLCFLETIEEMSDYNDAFKKYQKLLQNTAYEHTATRKQKISQMIIERQNFLKYVSQVQSSRVSAIEAKRRERLEAYLTKQQTEFADLKLAAENAAKQRQEAIEAEKKADQMLLESVSMSDKYRDEVIAEAKAELEAFYTNLMQQADERRLSLEKHIKNDQTLIEALEPNAIKALEFKTNRFAPMGKDKGDENSNNEKSPVKITPNISNQSSKMCIVSSEMIQQENTDHQPELQCHTVQNERDKNLVKPDNLLSDDPLTILRIKFRQRNKDGCIFQDQISEIIYGVHEKCSDTKSNEPKFTKSVETNNLNTVTSIESFRERNTFGHSSDSTIQHILYGKGFGPSSRPSVWEAEREKEDAVRLATELPELDAVTFYKEVLEFSENTSSVKPFTKEFPSLDRNCCLPMSSIFKNHDSSIQSSNELEKLFENSIGSLSMPLSVLINRSLIWPLSIHMKHVNSTLCNYFIFDLRLCDHFYCLYETYFLNNGSFARPLLNALFHKASGTVYDRANIFDTYYLQQLLKSVSSEMSNQQLLSNFNYDLNNYDNHDNITINSPLLNTTNLIKNYLDLISLSSISKTKLLSTVDSLNNDFNIKSNHSITDNSSSIIDQYEYISFKNLYLMYNAPWPINLCFNVNIIEKYNCIFQRLIECQFALWALNSCVIQLRNDRNYCLNHLLNLRNTSSSSISTSSSSPSPSSFIALSDQLSNTFHCIHLWLYELHQVIHALNMHLSNHINVCWSKFIKYLGLSNTFYNFMSESNSFKMHKHVIENVINNEEFTKSEQINNLNVLFNVHENYLDEILSGLLLDVSDNELNTLFQGLLTCAHQFHRALLTGRWIVRSSHHQFSDIDGTQQQLLNNERIEHTEWRQLYAVHASFRSYSQFLRRRVNRLLVHDTTNGGSSVRSARSKLAQLTIIFGLNDFYTSTNAELNII
uniref:GCP_C_terminal domain-containing protein n=2 Tax=Schistosoma mansoni TaxID=6183 RepID=A0A3Q0KSM5_SCHMA